MYTQPALYIQNLIRSGSFLYADSSKKPSRFAFLLLAPAEADLLILGLLMGQWVLCTSVLPPQCSVRPGQIVEIRGTIGVSTISTTSRPPVNSL